MKQFVQRAFRSAVFWSYLAVALRSGAAILILPLILRKLSQAEVGLWYVFLSMAGLAGLLDLGFSTALARSTGYLWSGAEKLLAFGVAKSEGGNQSQEPNFELLSSLVSTMRWFYLCLGALLMLVLQLGGGWWIWKQTEGMPHASSLRLAWAVFAGGCALNTFSSLWPNLLSGINGVRESQKIFFVSLMTNYVLSVAGLLAGWGIWGPVMGQVFLGALNRLLGRTAFLRMAGPKLVYRHRRPDWSLLKLLWPNSWRSGAITIGLYLMVYANTLLISSFLDLEATASYGLSLQVVLFLSQITTVWVMVKIPLIAQLRNRQDLAEIRRLFIPRAAIYLAGYVAGAIGLCLFGGWLLHSIVGAKTPLLPRPELAVMLLIIGLEAHHALYRELVLTTNWNPFVKPVLISGLCSVLLSMLLIPKTGIWGVIIAPGIVQLAFNNWWIVLSGIRSLQMSVREYLRLLTRALLMDWWMKRGEKQ